MDKLEQCQALELVQTKTIKPPIDENQIVAVKTNSGLYILVRTGNKNCYQWINPTRVNNRYQLCYETAEKAIIDMIELDYEVFMFRTSEDLMKWVLNKKEPQKSLFPW